MDLTPTHPRGLNRLRQRVGATDLICSIAISQHRLKSHLDDVINANIIRLKSIGIIQKREYGITHNPVHFLVPLRRFLVIDQVCGAEFLRKCKFLFG